MSRNWFSQFLILFWFKECRRVWRSKMGLLQDLAFPIAVSSMIIAAFLADVPSSSPLDEYTESVPSNWKLSGKSDDDGGPSVSDKLFFTAANFTSQEVTSVLSELYEGDEERSALKSRQFDNYDDIVDALYNPATLDTNADFILQLFRSDNGPISYTLQTSLGSLPSTPREVGIKDFTESKTWTQATHGVLDFQYRLLRGLNGSVGIDDNLLNTTIQRFPSNTSEVRPTNEARYAKARSGSSWTALGPPWWASSLIIIQVSIVRTLVRDKVTGIKYTLQSLGLSRLSFRLSNTFSSLLVYGSSILPSLALYFAIGVFYKSNFMMVWGAHLLFIIVLTSFSSVLASVLQKVASGAAVISFIIYGLGVGLGSFAASRSESEQLLSCLIPSSYLIIFMNSLYELENSHGGLHWDTLNTSLKDTPSVSQLYGMLFTSFVIFELITAILDNWEFIKEKAHAILHNKTTVQAASPIQNQSGGTALLSARKLVMTYDDGFTAVKGLDVDVVEGEVLGLLGHNGAGKSTTINMLQGMMPPTDGEIFFKNQNIAGKLTELRDCLGVCPQHDILFDNLTAREHLLLVGALKGVPLTELSSTVDTSLEEVGILSPDTPNLQHTMATNLSGGQKRKISVAMAFIGKNTNLVFLDEPTAGMDPASRRLIWEVVEKKKRENRMGIVLTTHFMDEADLLSDRIAIMHAGEICDEGSSLELKSRHSSGYTLTVSTSSADVDLLTEMRNYVPTLKKLSHCGDEIVFGIGKESLDQLPNLLSFLDLPATKGRFDIKYYGLSMGTLQDVFLALERSSPDADSTVVPLSESDVLELPTQPGSYVAAMFYKRFCCTRRDRQVLLFQLLFPIIFTVIGIIARQLIKDNASTTADYYNVSPYLNIRNAVYSQSVAEQDFLQQHWTGVGTQWDIFDPSQGFPFNTTDVILNTTSPLVDNWIESVNVLYSGELNYGTMGFWNTILSSVYPLAGGVPSYTIGNMPPAPWSATMAGDMILVISVAVGLSFMMSAAALFVVRERFSGCLNLQLSSGTPIVTYWVTTLIWDCVLALFSLAVLTLILQNVLDSSDKLQAWYASAVLFCIAACLLSYVSSFLFSDPTKAQVKIAGYLIGLSASFVIADLSVTASTGPGSHASAIVPIIFASINPTYSIAKVLMILINFLGQSAYLKDKHDTDDYFTYDILGRFHRIFGYQILGLLFLLILIELPIRRWTLFCKRRMTTSLRSSASELDPLWNGKVEPKKVNVQSPQVRVLGMTKMFKKGKVNVTVVDNIHLDIAKGCFGLLGVNGAGKSTLIKMLTGEYLPTSGDAEIIVKDGSLRSILSDSSTVRQNIGLCPQFDTFLPEMTGYEIIKFHCLLKGVPPTSDNIWSYLSIVGVQQYGNKPAFSYSGGNKRKLSLAISLVGRPPVVFLDEPSTGVDPKSKRALWDVIQKVAATRTVILTSHSMEEIDALSNRVGIMKAGKLLKLGTPQQLRSQLSSGYCLQFTAERESLVPAIIEELRSRYFPTLEVSESHKNRVVASIPGVQPSVILKTLRDNHLNIVEYAVTQTSLEQVFLDSVADHNEKAVPGSLPEI
eukprot:TRINITY_DN3884_c5_g1_i1.p1 TRINITY_DN3884_c5_g1~~TRINITY_DN3884_c5_g1_i1.p1  ORF type:complete len:1569 (+),score=289.39 TRINITY_DN3884_c5_g1_i1:66-4772(+)